MCVVKDAKPTLLQQNRTGWNKRSNYTDGVRVIQGQIISSGKQNGYYLINCMFVSVIGKSHIVTCNRVLKDDVCVGALLLGIYIYLKDIELIAKN